MVKRARMSKLSMAITVACIIFLGYGAYLLFNDMDAPRISVSHQADRVAPNLPIVVTVTDNSSAVQSISIVARHAENVIPVLEKSYNTGEQTQQLTFTLENTGLADEATFDLEITARDASYGGFGFGNKSQVIAPMRIDAVPPRISVKTTVPLVRRGGTGCLVYSVSKETQQTGVRAGDLFFPAFRQENGDYICIFAFPYNVESKTFTPQLFAVDVAGNLQNQELAVTRLDRRFRTDTINITQNFLDEKSAEFAAIAPGEMSGIERFLKVNGPVRRANASALMQVGKNTAPVMIWKGAFQRLPRAASRAGFADHRTYLWNGQKVDEQTHLGFDLASTKQSEVPAANSGIVVFTGYLGIYGHLVVIDHGLGLQSLYSHLSEIGVEIGQEVERGKIIGKTGATGMAGGDHLHFGILISGIEVTPLEWLDSHWIKDNVVDRINAAGGKAPPFEVTADSESEDSSSTPAQKPAKPAKPSKPAKKAAPKPGAKKPAR